MVNIYIRIRMTAISSFFLLAYHLAMAQPATNDQYIIKGKIEGMDKGKVYLYYPTKDRGITDSAIVLNGNFILTGKIIEPVKAHFSISPMYQQTFDRNFADIYIGPGSMKLLAKMDHFEDLQLTGSRADHDRLRLAKLKRALEDSIRPLMDEYQEYITQYRAERQHAADSLKLNDLRQKLASVSDSINPFYKREYAIDSLFVMANPDSYVSADIIWENIQFRTINFPSFENLYIKFSPAIKTSRTGVKIAQVIKKEKDIPVGGDARNFIAVDNKGDTIDLSAYKGKKYVLLDFGSSGCIPCRQLLPLLGKLAKKYNKELQVITISLEPASNTDPNVVDKDIDWVKIIEYENTRHIQPRTGTISDNYEIDLIP